jgi:hypothetical protein
MKPTGQFQKWGVGVLGAISLVLIVKLVLQFNGGHAGVTRLAARTPPHPKASIPPSAKAAAGKQRISDELSRYDSLVKLDLLKEFEARPLPELHRNPFEFVAGRTPVSQNQGPGAPPAAPQPPPPPPPVTLKVMGYTEGNGGAGEAMVELCATSCEVSSPDDQVFVVHAGDSVGTRYKIIKITPTVVSAEDAMLHQNVDLPVPQ